MIQTCKLCEDYFYAWIGTEKLFTVRFDQKGEVTNNPGAAVRSETVRDHNRHVLAVGETENAAVNRAQAVLKARPD